MRDRLASQSHCIVGPQFHLLKPPKFLNGNNFLTMKEHCIGSEVDGAAAGRNCKGPSDH